MCESYPTNSEVNMKKKKRRQATDFFDDKNEVEAERSVSSGSNKLIFNAVKEIDAYSQRP